MVTEKYLLRGAAEWQARQEALGDLRRDRRGVCRRGDVRGLGRGDDARTWTARSRRSSPGPATPSPRRSSPRTRATFGDDFWGFWMLGGMSGGGMGFFVAPHRQAEAQDVPAGDHGAACRRELRARPAVRDGAGRLRLRDQPARHRRPSCSPGDEALMPPRLLRAPGARGGCGRTRGSSTPQRRGRSSTASPTACRDRPELVRVFETLFNRLFPGDAAAADRRPRSSQRAARARTASTAVQHERIREDLQRGRIGLAQNRLPADDRRSRTSRPGDVIDADRPPIPTCGRARRARRCAAARWPSSRWRPGSAAGGRRGPGWSRRSTRSAKLAGRHRSFLEIHLAKSRRSTRQFGGRRSRTSSPRAT